MVREMGFLLAIQFLTRLPLPAVRITGPQAMARSMSYFSLTGLLIGGGMAGVYILVSMWLSATAASLSAVVFLIWLTGNLHTDGLMDTADGLLSGKDRPGMLGVMKDSRVGAHGATAGILAILARVILLAELPTTLILPALILIPALGRWSQVFGAARYPYAGITAGTASFTDMVGAQELAVASATAILASVILIGWPGLFIFAGVAAIAMLFNRHVSNQLGGVTGDTLGAANEITEIFSMLILTLIAAVL